MILNANKNRFKLLTNAQEKAEFMTLDTIDKWKERNPSFIQVVNLTWSDNECYQFLKKNIIDSGVDENIELQNSTDSPNSTSQQTLSNLFTKTELEYTPLVAQLFNECNLVERIMNKYKSILNEQDARKPVPTHKSNLIDIADVLNGYLNEYEQLNGCLPEELMQTNFDKLKDEWQKFSTNELAIVKNKIIDVEQSIRNQQNAEHDFKKFIFQNAIKPLEFKSTYSENDFKFSIGLFETQFDKELKDKMNTDMMSNISTMMDESIDYLDKLKGEIESFSKRFDEEKTIEELDKQKELKSTAEESEQFSETSDQISNLTDKENIFQPLASSSNISNELNIEMDIDGDCKSNGLGSYF